MPDNLGNTRNDMTIETFHISNIGRLLEQNEAALRSEIVDVYVNKQRNITNTGRLLEEYMNKDERAKLTTDAAAANRKAQHDEEVFK